MAEFPTFNGSWPWPWIGSYCIPSCITHRPLPTYQISLKSKKLFVDDGRTDGRTDIWDPIFTSTQSIRPKKTRCRRLYLPGSIAWTISATLSITVFAPALLTTAHCGSLFAYRTFLRILAVTTTNTILLLQNKTKMLCIIHHHINFKQKRPTIWRLQGLILNF